MSANIRIPAMLASFAASLTVTLLNSGHGGLTVLAAMLLIPGLMLAVGGVIDERDAAVAAARHAADRVEFWKDLSGELDTRARILDADLKDSRATTRTLATEHAKSVRPETALNVSRRWLNRRTYMAPDVAAIYVARAAQTNGGKS